MRNWVARPAPAPGNTSGPVPCAGLGAQASRRRSGISRPRLSRPCHLTSAAAWPRPWFGNAGPARRVGGAGWLHPWSCWPLARVGGNWGASCSCARRNPARGKPVRRISCPRPAPCPGMRTWYRLHSDADAPRARNQVRNPASSTTVIPAASALRRLLPAASPATTSVVRFVTDSPTRAPRLRTSS